MHRQLSALALATVAVLGTAATARAGEPQDKQVQRMVIVHGAPGEHAAAVPDPSQIPGDHLKVEDLAAYAPGESRSYTTEGGAEVTITRAQEGERYTLRWGKEQIEIGGGAPELALGAGAEGKRVVIRHQVESKDGDEQVEEERTVGGPALDLMVAGDGPPPLVVEIVGEKDGKTTRQVIVLKSVEKVETN